MAPAGTAAIVAGLGIATIYALQIVLVQVGAPLIVASIASDVAVTVALLVAARRRGLDLGLRWPQRRFVIAGLLIGISAWMVALQIVMWIDLHGEDTIIGPAVEQGSLWPRVFAFALLPAFAEELVFRGVLARGLATRWPLVTAVFISGVAFAAYHIVPAQALGVLPLGLALGLLAIRSGSVVPGMLAHFTNNLIALVLSRDDLPALSRVLGARPTITLVVAVVVLATGLLLTAKAPA